MLDLYCIHTDDYINHIDDKVEMYDLLLTMASEVRERLAEGNGAAALRAVTKYEQEAHEAFEGWCIPDSYIESGDEDELHELMENELFPPIGESGHEAVPDYDAEEWNDYDEYDEDEETGNLVTELLEVAASMTGSTSKLLRVCSKLAEDEGVE